MLCQAIAWKLRQTQATSNLFGDRVTIVADGSRAVDYTALAYPAAYVAFHSEDAERVPPGSAYHQGVYQRYAVIVGLEATADVRGQKPTEDIAVIRLALFRAIFNWKAHKQYAALSYDGCELMGVNRATTFWLFRFGTTFWICEDDGDQDGFGPPNVTDFDDVNFGMDFIDPHDRGLPPSEEYDPRIGPAPWATGPEGRIEHRFIVDFTNNPRRRRQ